MKTAKLSVLPIKDLNPAEYNPRKRLKPGDKEYEKIKHSIEEFGFADPVVVNSDMTIIGGQGNSSSCTWLYGSTVCDCGSQQNSGKGTQHCVE